MNAPLWRSHWPWEPEEDQFLVRKRLEGICTKELARELQRSPWALHGRMQQLRRLISEMDGEALFQNRREELELLDRLLVERRRK